MKRSDIPDEEIYAAIRKRKAAPFLAVPTPEELLADKYPPKVVLAKMERMVQQKKLECGVSLHTAWIRDYD